MVYCDVDECMTPAECVRKDGLAVCAAHRKQLQRHGRTKPVVDRPESQHDRLFRAALDLRDANSEDDQEYFLAERRFWNAFRSAAREYVVEHPEVISDLVRRFLSHNGRRLARR